MCSRLLSKAQITKSFVILFYAFHVATKTKVYIEMPPK